MGQETKPEADSEPKIAEAPTAPVVAAPVKAPVESLAETSTDHKEGSNLKNLFDQMMESNDDLATFITPAAP